MVKECKKCGNEFQAKREDTMYCSQKCKSDAFIYKKAKKISDSMAPPPPALGELGPQAHYIVSDLTRQRDGLEKDLRDERARLTLIVEKHQTLEKEFLEYKNETRFKDLENGKPDRLAGFLESDFVKKLTDVALPAIASKYLPSSGGMAGFNDARSEVLGKWFDSLDETIKNVFWQMVEPMSHMSPEESTRIMSSFINLMNKGTTAQAQAQPARSLGYG